MIHMLCLESCLVLTHHKLLSVSIEFVSFLQVKNAYHMCFKCFFVAILSSYLELGLNCVFIEFVTSIFVSYIVSIQLRLLLYSLC